MNLHKLSIIRSFIALLAILMAFYGYRMPEERLNLLPGSQENVTLYSDENWGGQTSVSWINKADNHWQCHLTQSEFAPVCGLSASLGTIQTPLDMTKYDTLSVKLKYIGEASKLRLYLRNYNSAYSNPSDPDSLKFNSVNIPVNEFNTDETIIKLSEFSVESWWIEERNIPRTLAFPEINKIVNIGIDYPYPQSLGEHSVQIESIDLIGSKFRIESYFIWLTVGLIFLISLEALATLATALLKPISAKRLEASTAKEVSTPKKTEASNTPSTQDDLTLKINAVFNSDKHLKNKSLILLKLNNDSEESGSTHKMDDDILNELFKLMRKTLRSVDTFTRWGEEEFLILSTDSAQSRALKLCARIHKEVNGHCFSTGQKTTAKSIIGVHIGGTNIIESDDFGTAFMRAEQALYKANSEATNTYWQDT